MILRAQSARSARSALSLAAASLCMISGCASNGDADEPRSSLARNWPESSVRDSDPDAPHFTPPSNRKITVSGSLEILDDDGDDPFGGGNESGKWTFSETLYLTDDQVQDLVSAEECVDDEVRGELSVDVQRLSSGDIRVRGTLKLYEGAGCETKDLDGRSNISFIVPQGRSVPFRRTVNNTDEGGDWVRVVMTVSNLDG